MKRGKREPWRLDPSEVGRGMTGHGGGIGRTGKTRFSRRPYCRRLTLTHMPTGIEVEGEIPEGRYSKRELRDLEEKVYSELFGKLEAEVAKQLRIPGR